MSNSQDISSYQLILNPTELEVKGLNLDRTIYKNRGLIGYDPKDVRAKIESLQKEHDVEIELLKRKIEETMNVKQQLLLEIEELKALEPVNPALKDISNMLLSVFIDHSQSIQTIRQELTRQENEIHQQLELKKEERDKAKEKVSDALSFLRSIRDQSSFKAGNELKE